jgi:hypothetical protein
MGSRSLEARRHDRVVARGARELRRRAAAAIWVLAVAPLGVGACSGFGTTQLYEDQLGFARALGDADKSATLLNIVRIRYGDSPTFLEATQVISGYQLQRNVTGGFEIFPAAAPSSFLSGSASAQLQQSPTFTFQPLSGDQFAKSFIRPLAPADLLQLAVSGLPVDVLFRLGVQSINGHSNAVALTQTRAAGSPEFFLLLRDLRWLQIAGVLDVRLPESPPAHATGEAQREAPRGVDAGPSPAANQASDGADATRAGRLLLLLGKTSDPLVAAATNEAKQLMGLSPEVDAAEIVYGRFAEPGRVNVLTRSMLGVLTQLAVQVDVPMGDVARGRTLETVGNAGSELRPVVVIHSSAAAPKAAFAAAHYGPTWFYIAEDDFDSKLAFTVVQILFALSRSSNAPGAVLTIPTH